MTRVKEQAIELLQNMPDDKIVYIIDILRGLKGLAEQSEDEQDSAKPHSAMGIFSKYANPDLIQTEKDAWGKAVAEKHDNN